MFEDQALAIFTRQVFGVNAWIGQYESLNLFRITGTAEPRAFAIE